MPHSLEPSLSPGSLIPTPSVAPDIPPLYPFSISCLDQCASILAWFPAFCLSPLQLVECFYEHPCSTRSLFCVELSLFFPFHEEYTIKVLWWPSISCTTDSWLLLQSDCLSRPTLTFTRPAYHVGLPSFLNISATSASGSLHCCHILLGILFIDLAFFFLVFFNCHHLLRLLPTALFSITICLLNAKILPILLSCFIFSIAFIMIWHANLMYLARIIWMSASWGQEILLSYYSLLIPVIRTVSATNIYWKNELTRDIWFWSTKTYSSNIAEEI